MNFASVMRLSWGGDDKSLLDLFSAIDKEKRESVSVSKVKGLRELNNLEYNLNLVATQAKCQRRRGFLGSKKVLFPP
jgi:hypothetical protein